MLFLFYPSIVCVNKTKAMDERKITFKCESRQNARLNKTIKKQEKRKREFDRICMPFKLAQSIQSDNLLFEDKK